MVRKLLADRFQLAFHRDTREISVYTLTVEKTGTKLTKSEGDLDRLAGMGFRGRPGAFFSHDGNMADFTGFLQTSVVDRPVIDKTGISGRFDFTLDWTPDEFELARLGIEALIFRGALDCGRSDGGCSRARNVASWLR